MAIAQIIGELVTMPSTVILQASRVLPGLRQAWETAEGAPCTVCEVETNVAPADSLVEGHRLWKVIAYGIAADTLDRLQAGASVYVEGTIWDEWSGYDTASVVLTLHATVARVAERETEQVLISQTTPFVPEAALRVGDLPNDYEFFYDLA
jgi:hypothetical protein